jgi:PAS domain S-box-containing protein
VAVDRLSLDCPTGAITVLVGSSGCGKTTCLRMVNRLVEPTSSAVLIDGVDVATAAPSAVRRQIGYVIQQGGLFPHRTVLDNVATVPLLMGWGRKRARGRARELMERVGLPDELGARYPVELSGGQQQRVGVARALAGDRIRHFETEFLRPDGMPIPVSLSLCPVFSNHQDPIGAVAIARDITEQRLTQAALAEVETRLQEGEALAHVGNWLWDLRTGTVQWSAEFHRIHGVDPMDFAGTLTAHLGMIHPEDREQVRTDMARAITTVRPYEREYRIIRPDQEERILHVRAQPTIGSEGTALGLWGIGQDVTVCRPPETTG